MGRKVIIDCDGGVDDCEALMLAFSPHLNHQNSDDLDILGVTCVVGNTSIDNVVGNVQRILKICNRSDIPVFKGAESSLFPDLHFESASYIHGSDGFAGLSSTIEVDGSLVSEELAPSALIRLVKLHPNQQITLVTLGPLTNVAMAYRLWSGIGAQLNQLIIMGGDSSGQGNMHSHVTAEFNFGYDPEAATIVLSNFTCPVTIVPFDTCMKAALPWEFRAEWLSANSTKADLLLRLEQVTNENRIKEGEGSSEGFYSCDLFALAVFLDPKIVKQVEVCHVAVETSHSQLTRGQMIIDRRNVLKCELKTSTVLELDKERLKAQLMKMF